MGVEAAFPAAPIGSGVDRALAVFNQFVIQSAQPIVSLSPFLIPLMIAVAIKLTAWLGPVAAIVVVLPVVGATFNAESVLQERALLPPPTARLAAAKQGSPVYKRETYDDAAKAEMEKKSKKKSKKKPKELSDAAKKTKKERLAEAQRLQAIVDSGTPLAPLPAAEQWVDPASGIGNSSSGNGARRSSMSSGNGVRSSTSRKEPPAAATGNGTVDPNAIAAQVNHIHTALYGKPAPAMHSLADVQKVLNGVRTDVGLPTVAASSAAELLKAVQETSASVGC